MDTEAVLFYYFTGKSLSRFYTPFLVWPRLFGLLAGQHEGLPSVFWNQDSSSSHLVSIIYLMDEFRNLDGLASRVALLQNEMTPS